MKKLTITGYVGQDAQILSGNVFFAKFSVAVSVGTKQKPKTDWIDVVCNDKLVDVARLHIKKGTKLLIEGFPTTSAYINKDNIAVATLKLYASSIEFLSHPANESESAQEPNGVSEETNVGLSDGITL